jgi:hypothetical protein
MYSAKGHLASPRWGCPIRTSPDQSLLAAPRGFSQPSTSFIGSWCQGIHRAPLLARRLDLSNPPSRQDQCSQKTLVSYFRSVRTLGTEPVSVCSTTLQLFRCITSARVEHQSSRLYPSVGRTATTNAHGRYARDCVYRLSLPKQGTKIARRLSSHGGLHRKSPAPVIRLSTPA